MKGFFAKGYTKALSLVLAVAVAVGGIMYARGKVEAADPEIALMDPAPYLKAVTAATKDVPNLDYSQVEGVEYFGTRIVRIPGENYGGVVAQVDAKGKVLSIMETKNTLHKDGTVTSDTFINGSQLASINLNEKTGEIIDGWFMQGDIKIPLTDDVRANVNWSCWANCMSTIMGVPNWVISTIIAICALACIGSAGAGCVLCAKAAVIAYGAEAAFCFGWCS